MRISTEFIEAKNRHYEEHIYLGDETISSLSRMKNELWLYIVNNIHFCSQNKIILLGNDIAREVDPTINLKYPCKIEYDPMAFYIFEQINDVSNSVEFDDFVSNNSAGKWINMLYHPQQCNFNKEKIISYPTKIIGGKLLDINVYQGRMDLFTGLYKDLGSDLLGTQTEQGPYIYSLIGDIGIQFIFENHNILLFRNFLSDWNIYSYDLTNNSEEEVIHSFLKRIRDISWDYNQTEYQDYMDSYNKFKLGKTKELGKNLCTFIGDVKIIGTKNIKEY